MTARCPAGHDSTELDYCSICGAAMSAGGSSAAPGVSTGAAGGTCPSCGEPRGDLGARYCEVCRYDFIAQKLGPAPRAAGAAVAASPPSPPPPPPPPPPRPPPPAPSGSALGVDPGAAYVLVVQVDPTLDVDPDAGRPCPTGVADITVPFDRPELLVGRKDELRDVHPDIPLADPGTSRRHAKFVRAMDGSLAFLDLASTNGSKLNGVEVPAGSRSALHPGDEVTLGRWTRIRVTVKP